MPEHLQRMRRESLEQWERTKAILEERLEYHRRRSEDERARKASS